ncbi:MAG: penicillin acylase family protein, partial [Bacteroidota bacterium]
MSHHPFPLFPFFVRLFICTVLFLALTVFAPLLAQSGSLELRAPDGTALTIDRDDFGVPSVTARSEAGVFFGQGFAVAQDRLVQMTDLMYVATGTYAAAYGPGDDADGNGVGDYVDADRWVREMFYTPAERAAQFEALSPSIRTMVTAYRDGINAYIDSTMANPAVYRPEGFADTKPWDADKVLAVTQYVMRQFGQLGGDELARQAELDEFGPAWFAANRPINDPTAPTTILAPPALVTTARSVVTSRWADLDAAAALQRLHLGRSALDRVRARAGLAPKFGSFAVAANGAATADGSAMLLGAPQMGAPSEDAPNPAVEMELNAPGYHATGMTLPGIPGVIIGRAADHAWTLTTGNTDNTDTFLVPVQGNRYRFDSALRPFERLASDIAVAGAASVRVDVVRTVHGPVYGVVEDKDGTYAAAWRMTFWEREVEALTAFYGMVRAENLRAFEAAVERMPMSFNVVYANRAGQIAYWHAGAYPDRAPTVDPRLPALGDGTEEWAGLVRFEDQPQVVDPAQGTLVNWNNKPRVDWDHGDHLPWTSTPSNGFVRTYDGVAFLDADVQHRLPLSFDGLRGVYRFIATNGTYPEYPGTYQQVIQFGAALNADRAENLLPPGQSDFVSEAGAPIVHQDDQWPLFLSAYSTGAIRLKPMQFATPVDTAGEGATRPSTGMLDAAYPNPVRSGARLHVPLRVTAGADLDLAVYDTLGRR